MIIKESIAGLNVRIDIDMEMETPKLDKFRYDFRCEPDMLVSVSNTEIKSYLAKRKGMKKEEAVEKIALDKFGAGLSKFGGICVYGQKADRDGETWFIVDPEEKGEWFVMIRTQDGRYKLFTTPWSHRSSFDFDVSCVLIADSDGGEVSEDLFYRAFLASTKRPTGIENFGKFIGILGHLFRNVTIKKWRLTE